MRKRIKPSHQWVILLAALLALFALLAGQVHVHERVEVIYQEILVRVFDGGKPVPGLRNEDFVLHEEGRPVKVAYCRELRRSLARPEVDAGITAAKPKPRLFLFMFWLNEESREWPKAWDYFAREIYRPGDRIVLSDASRAVEVRSLEGEKEKVDAFFVDLAEDLEQKQLSKNRLVSDLQRSASEFYDDLVAYNGMKAPPPEDPLLERFKASYLGALNEYRLERLKGDPAWLERLAAALKAVEAEKWALLFLQNERLPLLHRDSRLLRDAPMSQDTITKLKRFMDETERQVKLGSDVTSYLRDLRPLFVGANTTYHVFLSDAAGEMRSNEDLQWQPVFSSWEGAFRQISADTGGRVSNTTRLGEALRQAAEKEDIYYVLTFEPGPGEDRRRRLQIEMKRPGLKAVFSRKLELGEVFPLKIQALEWREGKLTVSLADYQRTYGDAGLKGRLRVGVRAHVRGGDPLAVEKEILAGEPAVDVEMALHFPEPGSYQVHVEVQDLLTGNRATAEKEIAVLPPPVSAPVPEPEVDAPPLPEELEPVMARAADYCRRLKEAAFRFYCLEKVEERVLERNPLTKRTEPVERRWEYDYQIIGAGGTISEHRRLVREGTRKMDKANATLETRFSSHYSVFMPVTLLAMENRESYAYRLAGRDRIGRSRCVVVEVTPLRAGGVGIAQGRAWIDERDGSVLKIEMNPRGVVGAEELEKAAKASQARMLLEVTHQYFVVRGGLRFPSMTMFREAYVLEKVVTEKSHEMVGGDLNGSGMIITLPQLEGRRREIEFYRLRQDYGKYRFFEVDSSVEIKQP
ncbi:MAG: hypothetical protein MUP71_05260 [Candidatus Aminicenantes bacterium]|nr:hypothetical protein [Candidatus Aminicenantes bacterium]